MHLPWPSKNAVFITSEASSSLLLRQGLKRCGWHLEFVLDKPKEAISLIHDKKAHAIIIDDTVDLSGIAVLRQFLLEPFAFCTPILLLPLKEDTTTLLLHSSFNFISIAVKPITSDLISAKFEQLILQWDSKEYAILRGASYHGLEGRTELMLDIFKKAMGQPDLALLGTTCLALHLLKNHDYVTSEKILIDGLSKEKHLLLYLVLADCYLKGLLYQEARQIFVALQDKFPDSVLFLADMIQVEICVENYENSLNMLKKMMQHHLSTRQSYLLMGQILFNLGRSGEAEKALQDYPSLLGRFKSHWPVADSSVKTT